MAASAPGVIDDVACPGYVGYLDEAHCATLVRDAAVGDFLVRPISSISPGTWCDRSGVLSCDKTVVVDVSDRGWCLLCYFLNLKREIVVIRIYQRHTSNRHFEPECTLSAIF